MRSIGLVAILLVFLVGVADGADLAAAAPSFDGVYGLRGARVLRVEKDHMEIFTESAALGGRARISGTAYDADGMTLRYFDGTSVVESQASWAIVEGHLWVGVMRPGAPGQWRGITEKAGIYCGDDTFMPEVAVRWDMEKGTWTLSFQNNTHPEITIDGIVAVPAGAGTIAKGGKKFLAVMRNDGTERRAGDIANWNTSLEEWDSRLVHTAGSSTVSGILNGGVATQSIVLSRSMVTLPGGWSVGAAGSDAQRVIGAEELVKGVAKVTGAQRWATYEQVGDVMIMPWSLDLGPAGLVPVRSKGEEIRGEWKGAGGLHVTIEETEKPKDYSHLEVGGAGASWVFGDGRSRLVTRKVEGLISHLTLTPDEAGIRLQGYGWDHVMNHGDRPGFIYWFVTGEGKLVRMIYPAYCDGGGPGWAQTCVVDVFERGR